MSDIFNLENVRYFRYIFKNSIDSSICRIVNDVNISVNTQDYLQRMQPIAVALDRAQRSFTTISDCIEIWNQLGTDLENQLTAVRSEFKKRRNMALGP